MPVEVEVDSAVTLLFVVLSPADKKVILLCAVLMPVEVEVDSAATLLFAVFSPVATPVDSEATLLCAVPMPVEEDVDSELNWPKLTASVAFTPAATLLSVTGVVEPTPRA
jgi:hypothetical protein